VGIFKAGVPMHEEPPKAGPSSSSKKSALPAINELTQQLDKTIGELEQSKAKNYARLVSSMI